MKKTPKGTRKPVQSESVPARLRVPGFITGDEIGLGDAIKRATSYLGIKACDGCERRAEVLNRWVAFDGRRK